MPVQFLIRSEFSAPFLHALVVLTISSPDNTLPGAIDLRSTLTIQVLINGVAYTPDLYGGRAPSLPGADEIIMTLPAGVAVSCQDLLQISVNGQLSNATSISIAAGKRWRVYGAGNNHRHPRQTGPGRQYCGGDDNPRGRQRGEQWPIDSGDGYRES